MFASGRENSDFCGTPETDTRYDIALMSGEFQKSFRFEILTSTGLWETMDNV